ncbi:MAG: hypothetical protein JWQ34_390 [Mucilaginibacter sp.]|nr:hypothetical protein [Mucilaginibacter sp.]
MIWSIFILTGGAFTWGANQIVAILAKAQFF